MALQKPSKHLRYSEVNFQGYLLQVNALLRTDTDSDLYLDGLLTNPLEDLRKTYSHNRTIPAEQRNGKIDQIVEQMSDLYTEAGIPEGFPPSNDRLETDPLGCIRDLVLATKSGTKGGGDESTDWITKHHVFSPNQIRRSLPDFGFLEKYYVSRISSRNTSSHPALPFSVSAFFTIQQIKLQTVIRMSPYQNWANQSHFS